MPDGGWAGQTKQLCYQVIWVNSNQHSQTQQEWSNEGRGLSIGAHVQTFQTIHIAEQ